MLLLLCWVEKVYFSLLNYLIATYAVSCLSHFNWMMCFTVLAKVFGSCQKRWKLIAKYRQDKGRKVTKGKAQCLFASLQDTKVYSIKWKKLDWTREVPGPTGSYQHLSFNTVPGKLLTGRSWDRLYNCSFRTAPVQHVILISQQVSHTF